MFHVAITDKSNKETLQRSSLTDLAFPGVMGILSGPGQAHKGTVELGCSSWDLGMCNNPPIAVVGAWG